MCHRRRRSTKEGVGDMAKFNYREGKKEKERKIDR